VTVIVLCRAMRHPHPMCPKISEYVPRTDCTGKGNDFESSGKNWN